MRRARNEPALIVGVVLALLLAASEFLLGWNPGQDWTEPAGQALAEAVAVLAGSFGIRQTVYGPKTVDETLDAETVLQDQGSA